MPKISRNKLEKRTHQLILDQLILALSVLDKKDQVARIFNNLFTRTEHLMLAKRLATAMFLEQGRSYADISRVLKISYSTISFVRQAILNEDKEYIDLIRILNKTIGIDKLQ